MKKLAIAVLLFLSVNSSLFPQSDLHHWQALMDEDVVWRYFPGTTFPGNNWISPDFDDSHWQRGNGSIGFGDDDDKTVIKPAISVFMRAEFEVVDMNVIRQAVLHVDYDDGFVAYLNGVEIVRDGIEGEFPILHDQPATHDHEAKLYRGMEPERFHFSAKELHDLLQEGRNVLAIEVHNRPGKSSDLTAMVFLSIGVTHPDDRYKAVPKWFSLPATTLTTSSLPIIVINTVNKKAPGDARWPAEMGIINADDNHIDHPFNDYHGRIEISLRGNSSRYFAQKSFRIETQIEAGENHNVSLLGLPEENDWVLYAPYADKTMMRNVLTYKLWSDLGYYAPRTRYVELILNNDYQGIYVFTEKIKIDKNRVNIASLDDNDVTGDKVTGGYLLRADKVDEEGYPPWSSEPVANNFKPVTLQFYDPDGAEMKQRQRDYIRGYIQRFENALSGDDYKSEHSGYRPFVNVNSFIDFMLVQEISKNVDGYSFSTYMFKDRDSRDGRLTMGPVWDFDLAYGNVDYSTPSMHTPGWLYSNTSRMFWFRQMMSDPYFSDALKCRWHTLRNTWLTDAYFLDQIDSIASVLDESQQRHYQRWETMGKYVWPNQYVGTTYQEDVTFLKEWIANRLAWMDRHLAMSLCSGEYPENYTATIYPNPGTDYFTIPLQPSSVNKMTIEIYSGLGRLELSHTTYNTEFVWYPTTTPAGIYHVRVFRDGVMVSEQRVLKY